MKRCIQSTDSTKWAGPGLLLAILAATVWTATAYSETDYDVFWSTVDAGKVGVSDASTGGSYTLSDTIGQADARNHPQPMTGGIYSMTGGFWGIPECPAIPCDYDGDCDVDQGDYALFEACASGPEVQHGINCGKCDFDEDGDVDEDDFSVFQRCYSGENVPADPSCGQRSFRSRSSPPLSARETPWNMASPPERPSGGRSWLLGALEPVRLVLARSDHASPIAESIPETAKRATSRPGPTWKASERRSSLGARFARRERAEKRQMGAGQGRLSPMKPI